MQYSTITIFIGEDDIKSKTVKINYVPKTETYILKNVSNVNIFSLDIAYFVKQRKFYYRYFLLYKGSHKRK